MSIEKFDIDHVLRRVKWQLHNVMNACIHIDDDMTMMVMVTMTMVPALRSCTFAVQKRGNIRHY